MRVKPSPAERIDKTADKIAFVHRQLDRELAVPYPDDFAGWCRQQTALQYFVERLGEHAEELAKAARKALKAELRS